MIPYAAITVLAILLALAIVEVARADIVERTTGPTARWSNPVNRNLYRLAQCETGYLPGSRPNWQHHNSTYSGALGFAHSTWSHYKRYVRPVPRARFARDARPAEQYAVGRVLVRVFGGYSPWPSCSIRLGLR